jgi:hypothetical protein
VTPRRAARLLGAAAITTVVVTVSGVLLGPAASDPAPGGATRDETAAGDTAAGSVAPVVAVPEVPDLLVADFAVGDGVPIGAKVVDSGANASGLALAGGRLSHGAAEGPASGFLEASLGSDVRALGVRVVFSASTSGSVALVGWRESLVKARKRFGPTPATGMRLVAGPGHWELSVVDNDVRMLGSADYEPVAGPATFELVRDGATLYVVDPHGAVTVVEDKRVARLAGPWASWGLTETGPEQVPASIEAVWAG